MQIFKYQEYFKIFLVRTDLLTKSNFIYYQYCCIFAIIKFFEILMLFSKNKEYFF